LCLNSISIGDSVMWGPWSAPVSYVSEEERKRWQKIKPVVFWTKLGLFIGVASLICLVGFLLY